MEITNYGNPRGCAARELCIYLLTAKYTVGIWSVVLPSIILYIWKIKIRDVVNPVIRFPARAGSWPRKSKFGQVSFFHGFFRRPV
jgi:hypothetical protein